MKAVVTGGGGFLGQAIVERLLAEGHEPTVLGRSDYPELRRLGVRCVRRDVAEPQGLEACFAGQDVVFHAAAKPGVWGPRQEYWRANVAGTDNVIAACRAAGVARLVHTSSPSVVFDGRPHRDAGNDLGYPARYECPYPETKAEAERRVLAANDAGLATIALRPHLGLYTQPLSCIGLPIAAVPIAHGGRLPIGIQVIAAPWREDLCLRVAAALEARRS